MKNYLLGLLVVTALCHNTEAQQNLSANIYTGWLFPFNDFTQLDYVGNRPNLAVGAGMGYSFGDAFRLRGDLLYGNMNGNDNSRYYESEIFEPSLGFDLNFIQLVSDYDGIKLNLQAGTGISYYRTSIYDRATSARLNESPVRSVKALSPNAFILYGANIGIKLSHKLDLNLGYTNRYVIDNDWMDGFKGGEFTDHYGMAQIGFVFYLKSDRKPGTVEVDESKYRNLTSQAEQGAKMEEDLADQREQIAELEMQEQENQVEIAMLKRKLDSANYSPSRRMDTVRSSGYAGNGQAPTEADAAMILSQPQYRIIVASLPTRPMAQRYIDKSRLDKSEMVIAYIENISSYRIVYKSFDTYEAARKELLNIRDEVSDAWIIRF